MHPQLNQALGEARQQELLALAARERRGPRPFRRRRSSAPAIRWQGLTLRLATSADRSALARLAELEQAASPQEPVLLGEVMQRPVAALSLRDGRVVADPFMPTAELVELMRLRARQITCS
ncbi:MAG TPA: hypothetical protein VGG41_12345 [Solirubrobacteraceae bacterium]